MKTLYRTYTAAQARAKQIELEKATGLKWDFYHVGDGYIIQPIATKNTPTNEDLAVKLLPFLSRDYETFDKLAAKSGMSLADVIAAAKTLV